MTEAETSPAVNTHYLENEGVAEIMRLARTCAVWNQERLFGVAIDGNMVTYVAASAFGLVHEHHGAILTLLTGGRLGSAFALLRPCFESLIRGLWLVHGANQTQIDAYVAGKDTKKVEGLLRDLRKGANAAADAALYETWTKSEKSLHRFTHVSYQLLIRRLSFDLVETPMPATEVVDAIRFATGAAMLASAEVARLGKNSDLEQHAMRLFNVLNPGDGKE